MIFERHRRPRKGGFQPLGLMNCLFVFALLCLVLTACGNGDAVLSTKLVGTWTNTNSDTFTFSSNGSFATKSAPPPTADYQGTWEIADGVLYSTITNAVGSNTVAFGRPLGFKIVELDEHKLVYKVADRTFSWSR